MSADGVTDAHMVAAALQGEASFWFAVPKSGKPLPESWTSVNCYWVYPVEHDLVRFAKVKGFDPTDSVYELDTSGVSKVFPSATLKANVAAKRYQKDGATYFFVPAEEVDWVEREYRAMLKREKERPTADSIPSNAPRRVEPRRNAAVAPASDKGSAEAAPPQGGADSDATGPIAKAEEADVKAAAEKASDDGGERDGEDTDGSDDGADGGRARRGGGRQRHARPVGSHKRREPHRGTTTFVAPVHEGPVGHHRSNEAFTWPAHFIVHRGSADYLCAAATGNSFGFRLDKVTHNGFPVFLLFGSAVNNSDAIDASAKGVPAMETAVLRGEGGERGMGNTVMIITRPPSDSHRQLQDVPSAAVAGAKSISRADRRKRRRAGTSSDDDDHDEASLLTPSSSSSEQEMEESIDDGSGRRRRGGQRSSSQKASISSSGKAAKPPRADPPPEMARRVKKEREPLKAASVNMWTDPDVALPDVEQLAKRYPFAHDTAAPLRTTVFSDGTCVTYSAASAEKVQTSVNHKKKCASQAATGSSGLSGGATRIGGSTPDDDAIRSLLENVQLAQLQNQSASGTS